MMAEEKAKKKEAKSPAKGVKRAKAEAGNPVRPAEAEVRQETVAKRSVTASVIEMPAKQPESKQPKKESKPAIEAKKPSYKITRSPEAQKLAKEKRRLEKKKGKFKRPMLGLIKRVPDRWRRPKGIDSRQQNHSSRKPPVPDTGYMTPKAVKGLHTSGYRPVRVFTMKDLDSINKQTEAIVIASSVGKKKRIEIQNKAKNTGIQILNYKE